MSEATCCHLTTTGRVSGEPHTIEIWFVKSGKTLHMMAGGRERADWVRNLQRYSAVTVRLDDIDRPAQARVVEEGTAEDAAARLALVAKYQTPGTDDLVEWGRSALVVAVDLD